MKYSLTGYIDSVMSYAQYDKLADGSFAGRIPKCKGVIAFAKSLRECEDRLRSTLEDWIILGLKLGHHLPVINGINLNRRPRRESGGAL
jgi:predicted RNase H-like HicB family nuclease